MAAHVSFRCAGLFALLFVFGSTTGGPVSQGQGGEGCGASACPSYTVEKTLESDIEERQYGQLNMPSYTSTRCLDYGTALSQAYFQLSMYTRAAQNANRTPLKMGVPVLTQVKYVNDVEPKCAQIFTSFFYVDGTPLPAPTNADIKITSLEDNRFYVQTIGGYISDHESSLVDFRVRLNSLNLCYDEKEYFVADYQSPGKKTQRKNEIWVPVRVCSK